MNISSENKIKSRRYDLTVFKNGEVVGYEYGLTPREKKEIAADYRKEGFTVNSEESFSVTKNHRMVGEKPINNHTADPRDTKYIPGPVEMTERKIEQQRVSARTKAEELAFRKLNANGKTIVHRNTNGRDKNSPMHDLFVAAMRKSGYKVKNLKTGKFFYGFQSDVVRYLKSKFKDGYKVSDFDIKYIGE